MATQQIARGLASLGRNGDSVLVHMQPDEVAGLQALANARGTSLTVNPHTGMPEAFSLGGFFTSLLPTIAGLGASAVSGGALTPMVAGILAGSATGALTNQKDPLLGAMLGGLGGFGGANIGSALSAAGGAAAVPGSASPSVVAGNGIDAGYSLGGGETLDAFNAALPEGANWAQAMPENFAQTAQGMGTPIPMSFSDKMSNMGQGFQNLLQGDQGAIDAARAAVGIKPDSTLGLAGTFGMPVAGAALGGLEPSDLGYGMTVAKAQKGTQYDPYASLNLDQPTGLRLLAEGGQVTPASIYDNAQYSSSDSPTNPALSTDGYGIGRLDSLASEGSRTRAQSEMYARGGYLDGAGDGMSDSIPATIEGKQPARLADGEFVVPADVVSHLGNGSTKAGAKQLYSMLNRVRKARTGRATQGRKINPSKLMPR